MIRGATVTSRAFLTQGFETLTTPLWWYSFGIVWLLGAVKNSAVATWEHLGVGLWARNLFVPMYGQSDIWGRIISFIVRFVNVIFRLIGMALWMVVLMACAIVWCAGPLAALVLLYVGVVRLVA